MSDINDWLRDAVIGTVSGVTGAFAWFRGEKIILHDRMEKMEGAMRCYDLGRAEHATQIAVLEQSNENIVERFDRLEHMGDTMNTKLDAILTQQLNNHNKRT